jgi:hypothetical protein
MFIIDWVFDKMGYTKKVHWLIKATPKKPAVKRKPAVKKTPTKTVRKKNG